MNQLLPCQYVTEGDTRRSDRWETYLHASVANRWQEQSQAVVTNISDQGIRLEGSRQFVDVIFPNFKNNPAADDHAITLRMVLEEGIRLTDSNAIEVTCRCVYVLREKRDWFQVGLCYQDIDADVAAKLELFIVEMQRSSNG